LHPGSAHNYLVAALKTTSIQSIKKIIIIKPYTMRKIIFALVPVLMVYLLYDSGIMAIADKRNNHNGAICSI